YPRHRVGEFGRRRRLAPQVEFAQRPASEIGDHLPRAEPARLTAESLKMGGRPFVSFDVAGELLVDAGAAHLDRDLAPIGRYRAVDLRDRSRSHWFGVEFGIEAFERRFEGRLDFLPDAVEGDGGQRVLQGQKIARRLLPDKVWACRERLPQLDGCRTDRLKGRGVIGNPWLNGSQSCDPAQSL